MGGEGGGESGGKRVTTTAATFFYGGSQCAKTSGKDSKTVNRKHGASAPIAIFSFLRRGEKCLYGIYTYIPFIGFHVRYSRVIREQCVRTHARLAGPLVHRPNPFLMASSTPAASPLGPNAQFWDRTQFFFQKKWDRTHNFRAKKIGTERTAIFLGPNAESFWDRTHNFFF